MFNIKEIDSQTLSSWMNEGRKMLLLDVRTPNEYAQGIIAGGQLMPLHTLPMRIQDLPRDMDVVIYCRTGARSAQACAFLTAQGFDNTYNLRGGIMDWARSNLPVTWPESTDASTLGVAG